MDWEPILLFTAIWGCVATLARLIVMARKRGVLVRGWIATNILVLIAISLLWEFVPDRAGTIGFSLWAVFVLVPSLMQRRALQLTQRQQYHRAARIYSVAAWLHPLDGWPRMATLLRALGAGEAGDIAGADIVLATLEAEPNSNIKWTATVHRHRLQQQWPQFVQLIRDSDQNELIRQDVRVFPTYIRALGEVGDLNGMTAAYDESAAMLEGRMLVAIRPHVRCCLFAFCGRREALGRLLDGPMSYLPGYTRQLWLGIAEYAAGNSEAGAVIFERGMENASPYMHQLLQRRLNEPPSPAHLVLTEQSHRILDAAERDSDHEAHFSGTATRRKRPWITHGLVLANIVMFLVEIVAGGATDSDTLIKLGAMHPQLVLAGQWWRLIAVNFLHYGFLHLLFNMAALLLLGPFVERKLGTWRFLMLYFISGVGAAAVVLWLQFVGWIEANWLVGASGAIMGVIGATAGISLREWFRHKARIARTRLWEILAIVAVQVVFDTLTPQVSSTAHLAGAGIGFILSLILWRIPSIIIRPILFASYAPTQADNGQSK